VRQIASRQNLFTKSNAIKSGLIIGDGAAVAAAAVKLVALWTTHRLGAQRPTTNTTCSPAPKNIWILSWITKLSTPEFGMTEKDKEEWRTQTDIHPGLHIKDKKGRYRLKMGRLNLLSGRKRVCFAMCGAAQFWILSFILFLSVKCSFSLNLSRSMFFPPNVALLFIFSRYHLSLSLL